MQNEPQLPQPNERMLKMVEALSELRDSWIRMSLALSDMLTDQESPQRDAILVEVESYLTRLRELER